MVKKRITVGGWYQRTTLHLSEIYEFLSKGISYEPLDKKKLNAFYKKLEIRSVERKFGELEHIKAITNTGIEITYYEDGLYLIESTKENVEEQLITYFEKTFKPAIAYLFSLGAPTPKILASIKDKHPVVISQIAKNPKTFKIQKSYGKVYSSYHTTNISVYKTSKHIFIIAKPSAKQSLERIVGIQIFFREFKDQLRKYLHIHRVVWEEIKHISERDDIKGNELDTFRANLESYKKTIHFISERMAQMEPYAKTREQLAGTLNVQTHLVELFHYRFEDLFDTLQYVQKVWNMTVDYVEGAIQLIAGIQASSTGKSIRSIQVLASIGVVAGFMRYLGTEEVGGITQTGILYLAGLIFIAYLINISIKNYYKNKNYSIRFVPFKKFE